MKPAYSSQVLEKIIKIPSVIMASKLVGSHDLVAISIIKNFHYLCELRDNILEMPYVDKVGRNVDQNYETMPPSFYYLNYL